MARTFLLTTGLVALLCCLAAPARPTDKRPQGKKLIEWGWDEPDPKFMREHVEAMERLPFDGLVFHAVSGQGNFTWEAWGGREYSLDEFRQCIDDLKATPFRRLTDRFLRVNVTPGRVDWFDDRAWAAVVHNAGVAAQIAKDGGCKGFMFDVEQYEGRLFDYRQQKHRDARTFADYRSQVRRRGKEWVEEVNRHFPDVTVLLTFGYSIAQPKGQTRDHSQAAYGLLADFLDGVLDGCSEQTQIVDAWESSYRYREPGQFDRAYETITKTAPGWTALPEKYRKQVRAGFGLWMDADWRKTGWDLADFSKNYFTPGQFEAALDAALRRSDRYVWVYTEQPRWWTNEKLPPAYAEAVRKAGAGVD